MKRFSQLACAVLALVVVLFVAACGGDDDSDGGGGADSNNDPITIGFAMGFTGFANAFDGPVFRGAQIAIDDLNAEGGIAGRQVEIVRADTRSDLPRVPTAALDVIERGADIVVTTCDYDYGAPAARVAIQRGILAFGCAGHPLYGEQGIGDLAFNMLQTTPTEAAIMAKFAASQEWQRAYLLVDTTIEYSKAGCEYVEETLTDAGINVVGQDTFQNDDPSVSAQVSRMAGSNADFIAICSYPPGAASAIRQMRAGGVDVPILGQAGVDGRLVADAAPNLSDLYYLSVGSIHGEGDPEKTELGQKYRDLVGNLNVQDYAPLMGYAEIEAIALAIERNDGSTDGEELARVLEQFDNEELIVGPTTYTEECHAPVDRPMAVFTIQQGEVEVAEESVAPENVPEAPC